MSLTSDYTTPLTGNPYYRSTGIIKAADLNGARYCIAEISYERFDDQNFQYIVSPYWEQIAFLPTQIFSGIPGFDLSARRDHYYRVNITPSFIQMRTPSESREDLWDLLAEVGLDYYDRFEWLLRSEKRCGDDNLIVVRKRENRQFDGSAPGFCLNDLQPGDLVSLNHLYDISTGNTEFASCAYRLLVNGSTVYLVDEGRSLTAFESRTMLYLLNCMLEYTENYAAIRQEQGIRRAKEAGKYPGRSRISVDPLLLKQIARQFQAGEISEEEALKTLHISRSTFYRRLREQNL